MTNLRVTRHTLSLTVLALYLALFAAGTWASSNAASDAAPQNAAPRWHPRRVPVGTEFLGDQVCAECHKNKVTTHGQSAMGMAMEAVSNSLVLTQNPAMTFRTGPYTYEIKRQDKQSLYTVTDGKETIKVPILYALGQGKAGQTYVLEYQGGLYESLVSYYKEAGGLDFTIGAPRTVPVSLEKALGRRLGDHEAASCFSCHSTGSVTGGQLHLDQAAAGIRCEGCHGPGGKHVTASRAGEPSAKLIFNPGRLGGDELSQDFCGACHRGTEEFNMLKSLEINNVRFQPYRIFHSKCYSDDRRISCTACHDPHEPLKREVASYDAKCTACHAVKAKPGALAAKPAVPGSTVSCPVSTKDCVSCHMPKFGPPAAHFKFTDHYIRIVKSGDDYPN
ncbi:MAG TPA: multiheme c-type cytochrome [Blastocatellia bacterium]|nr:multiheme c-type cytochrome [Blastocatellia bacterium]